MPLYLGLKCTSWEETNPTDPTLAVPRGQVDRGSAEVTWEDRLFLEGR